MKIEIAKAIALLTAEYDLPPFGPERIEMWMTGLAMFPPGSVARSTENYIRTNRFKPQLADIVAGCAAQVAGNWLGADEAWALMPKSESDSAMLTNEIAQAIAAASPLLEAGDRIAARMAFRDAYNRLVEQAKIDGRMPVYFPSFGTDKLGVASMLANAVRAGQIELGHAVEVRPEIAEDVIGMVGVTKHPLLAAPSEAGRGKIKEVLALLQSKPVPKED